MLPRPEKRQGRWTLLLVDDCGRSIQIRWCKAWIAIVLLLTGAASGTAVFTYCMYHTVSAENRSLRASPDKADKQNPILAQNRQTASKPAGDTEKTMTVPLRPDNSEKNGEPDVQADSDKTGESAPPASPEKPAEPGVQDNTARESVSSAGENVSPAFSASRVSVGDFACSFSEQRESLDIRFHIRNTNPEAGPVSGLVFVILKTEENSSPKWLLLPDGKTVSGKLPEDAAGESFSISRFRFVEIKAKGQKKSDEYKTATVIVSDENRNILLEENFPLVTEKPS